MSNRTAGESASQPSGVLVSELVVRPSRPHAVRAADATLCVICIDGAGALEEPARTYPITEGFMAVRQPGWSGRIVARGVPVRAVAFTWSPAALAALGPLRRGLATARTFFGRSSVDMAWRAAVELRIADEFTPHALDVFARGVAIGLSRNLLYGSRREPPLAARARRQLKRDLRAPLDLARLARELGCSPAYLSRLFRHTYGFSPSEWLLRERVEQARQTLTRTRRSVGDIARDMGFHDASHFARHFRRYTGLSPSEFRIKRAEVISVPE